MSSNSPSDKYSLLSIPTESSPALLYSPATQFYYLDIDFFPEPGDLITLATPTQTTVFHSPLLDNTLISKNSDHLSTIPFTSKGSLAKTLTSLSRKKLSTLYLEPSLSLNVFNQLSKIPGLKLKMQAGLADNLSLNKSKSQIDKIKESSKIAAQTFNWIINQLNPGITELQVVQKINAKLLEFGAQSPAFNTIVSFGENTSFPHHIPTKKKLAKSSIVLIDLGAKSNDYLSDMTRTILPTNPSTKMLKAFSAVMDAYDHSYSSLSNHNQSYSHIDSIARSSLKKSGFNNNPPHAIGHGLGADIHEPPQISPVSKYKVVPNQIITLEPAIYIPGKFGIRYENTILTTKTSPINLTDTSSKYDD